MANTIGLENRRKLIDFVISEELETTGMGMVFEKEVNILKRIEE